MRRKNDNRYESNDFYSLSHTQSSISGISMGSRQVDPAMEAKCIETFRVCREFFADHFGNKLIEVRSFFHRDIRQILSMDFASFCKN